MPSPSDHRRILDLAATNETAAPPHAKGPELPVGAVRLSPNQTLSAFDRSAAGAMLLVETAAPTGNKAFRLHVPLNALSPLIDLLVQIEQTRIDEGQLPERDEADEADEAGGAGAQP
jgi:hypothetical protein